MRHDPERDAARYLGGELSTAERARYERHLLGCDRCWAETQAGERGRQLVTGARELAPAHLRDLVRSAVRAEAAQPGTPPGERVAAVVPDLRRRPRSRPSVRTAVAVAVTVLVAGTAAGGSLRLRDAGQPPAIAAAVEHFRTARPPGEPVPGLAGPDLSSIGLRPLGGSRDSLSGLTVTAYTYVAQDTGAQLVVYVGAAGFPRAHDAESLGSRGRAPWLARDGGLALLCASQPTDLLIVAADAGLARAVASQLQAA